MHHNFITLCDISSIFFRQRTTFKTLKVQSTTKVDEVIQIALQKFSIQVCWVHALYVHAFPCSIFCTDLFYHMVCAETSGECISIQTPVLGVISLLLVSQNCIFCKTYFKNFVTLTGQKAWRIFTCYNSFVWWRWGIMHFHLLKELCNVT